MFVTLTETVGKTAGHTDVPLWYVLKGDRSATLAFDDSECHRVRWFHRDEIPMERTDPHMVRFLRKPSAA